MLQSFRGRLSRVELQSQGFRILSETVDGPGEGPVLGVESLSRCSRQGRLERELAWRSQLQQLSAVQD